MSIISIRHSEPEDLSWIKSIYEQKHVYTDTLQLPFPPARRWQSRLADADPNRFNLVICADEKVVGHLGLEQYSNPRRRHVAGLGMAMHKDWLRQGLGSRLLQAALDLADNWLQVTRIELEVYKANEAGAALYQKFGFVVEGESARFAYRDGELADVLRMARLNCGEPG